MSAGKMGELMMKYIDKTIKEFKPREKYECIKVDKPIEIPIKGVYNETKKI